MREKGTHTVDIHLEYCRCPNCGYIIENREGYLYILGKQEKEVQCGRCAHRFKLIEDLDPRFGPLIN